MTRQQSRLIDRPIPIMARAGLLVMSGGFIFDLIEHGLVIHAGEIVIGSFPLSEHAAHLVVMVGMVVVLTGVVLDRPRQGPGAKPASQ